MKETFVNSKVLFFSRKTNHQRFVTFIAPVAHAENVHGRVSFSGIWWSFVFGVRCWWRRNMTSYHVSKPTLWRSLLT